MYDDNCQCIRLKNVTFITLPFVDFQLYISFAVSVIQVMYFTLALLTLDRKDQNRYLFKQHEEKY